MSNKKQHDEEHSKIYKVWLWVKRWWLPIAILLITSIGLACALSIPQRVFETPREPANDKSAPVLLAQSNLRLAFLYITGGAIAVMGLVETFRKNNNEKLKNDQDKEKNDRDHLRQVRAERRERYTKAVEQLGSQEAPVRMGGVYTLVGLVDEWLEEKSLSDDQKLKEGQVIINNLCAYIRSPFTLTSHYDELSQDSPTPEGIYKDKEQEFYADKATLDSEADVRLSIIKEIHDRIQGPDKNTPGAWSDFEYDFSGSTFFYPIDLTNSYYAKPINFSGSTYKGGAYFTDSTYKGGANFIGSTYEKDVTFSTPIFRSTYVGKADFRGSTYQGGADFRGSTYQGGADFTGSTYQGGADFTGSTYQGWADFTGSTYQGWANFSSSTYQGWANFSDSTYQGWANFSDSTYEKDVTFSTPIFRSTYVGKADFRGSTYEGGAYFSRSTYEGGAYFSRSTYKDVADFGGSTYQGEANFDGSTYNTNVAAFNGSTYHGWVHFSGSTYQGQADFSYSTYHGWVYFSGSTYQWAYFSDSIYQGQAVFSGSTYQGWSVFSGSIFNSDIYFGKNRDNSFSLFTESAPQFYYETNRINTLFGSPDNNFTVENGRGYPIYCNIEGLPLGCKFLTSEQKEYLEDKFQEIEKINNKLLEAKDNGEKAKLLDTLRSVDEKLYEWRKEVTTVKVEDLAAEDTES